MVLRLEGVVGDLAPTPDLDVLRVVLADRRVGMCHVRDLRLLVPQPLLELLQLPFFGRQPLLHGTRLLDEPRPGLLVTLPTDAPCHLVLALLELIRLLYEIRAPVGQLYNQAHVGLYATVSRVLLDGFRVLADVFEIKHHAFLRSAWQFSTSAFQLVSISVRYVCAATDRWPL